MSAALIEAVLDCQTDLITAIDRQDADAIVRATEALAGAVATLRDAPDWPGFAPAAERLRYAMAQNGQALMRINLLKHWTRQRIDRVNELRRGVLP